MFIPHTNLHKDTHLHKCVGKIVATVTNRTEEPESRKDLNETCTLHTYAHTHAPFHCIQHIGPYFLKVFVCVKMCTNTCWSWSTDQAQRRLRMCAKITDVIHFAFLPSANTKHGPVCQNTQNTPKRLELIASSPLIQGAHFTETGSVQVVWDLKGTTTL